MQEARRRFDPFTSTKQSRQAPTVDSPSISQSRGMKMLFWRATSRMVSSARALKSRPSIFNVFTLATGVIELLPYRKLQQHIGCAQCGPCTRRRNSEVYGELGLALTGPNRTGWCFSPGRTVLPVARHPSESLAG